MASNRFKIQYQGSVFWLIFWLIFFFPIALILFFTASIFEIEGKIYTFEYDGSIFWLAFWTLFFFPIALILLIVNGFSIRKT